VVTGALDSGSLVVTAGAGCGKTTILEESLAGERRSVAWIRCSERERAPGVLLMRIVDAIADAAPGASDVLAERLATAPEQIDAVAAIRELLAELARLLVEPLVLVVDDAEHLDGAPESLRLLDELIRDERSQLHVAVASRRSLDLRLAKPRAAGRLTELTAADLAFEAQECAAMLQSLAGVDPVPDRVEQMMEATEGWPLGVALATGLVARGQRTAGDGDALASLASTPDLRSYVREELLDSLEPELRQAVLASSVVREITPEIASALELPDEFGDRLERAGVLIRRLDERGTFAHHPLLRELFLERLRVEWREEELRRAHAAVASALAEAGDGVGTVEHWLEAKSWTEAAAVIEREGLVWVRTSPELMRRWLAVLPPEARALPTIRAFEGQLEWLAGRNAEAIDALREAIRGFRDRQDPPAEWIARSILVDLLFAEGEVDQFQPVVEGWDRPAAGAAGGLAPAAAAYAATGLASFARFEESDRLAEAAKRHPEPALVAPLEALRLAYCDAPCGLVDEACERLEAADLELERFDPLNRRVHVRGALAFMLLDRGRPEDALRMWMRIRDDVRGGTAPVLADAALGWAALLHAQAGRLAEAEAELASYGRVETGARAFIGGLAPATVASLRGDAPETIASAELAFAIVDGGPTLFRYWVGIELVPPLAMVDRDRARAVLADVLAVVDQHYPEALGCYPRGRVLALRAWLAHGDGELSDSDADLRRSFEDAGQSMRFTLRREWPRLERVLWSALERGVLEPAPTVDAVSTAFPDGLQLVPFLDHPVPAVRRAALEPAVGSGDPTALAHLRRLEEDPDPELADAAARAVGRLGHSLPPLRFELLGRFVLRRGSWSAGEHEWKRPIDARLVRFLLVHLDRPVQEDLIFEALWPDLSPSSARRSLHVAVSRARRMLDPPGAERSTIQSIEGGYRLALGQHDAVDADQFRSAAEAALAEPGQRGPLEHARSLWGGEPLPEERYSDWATAYREQLIDRYIAVLTGLISVHERGDEHDEAAGLARELIELDPLNEEAHRALMKAYARAGRTGHALRQFLACRRALVDALGIEPAEATSRLQARILAGEAV
jgi:DNA-binding SARP family transcriptional activator/tetratricopeptide (TPR) repeat protein